MGKSKKMFGSERLGLLFLGIVIALISAIAMLRSCNSNATPNPLPPPVSIDSLQSIKIVKDTVKAKKSKTSKKKEKKQKVSNSFKRNHLSEPAD